MPKFQPSTLPAGAYRVNNKNHDTWIVDADGNIIGQTGANGQDTFFTIADTNPLTGVVENKAGGKTLNPLSLGKAGPDGILTKYGRVLYSLTSLSKTPSLTNATASLSNERPRFGPYTRKITVTSDTGVAVNYLTIVATPDADDVAVSVDMYFENIPDANLISPNHSYMTVTLAATNSPGANYTEYYFSASFIRQGWNTIKMRRDDVDNTRSAGNMALGCTKAATGTGMDWTQPIRFIGFKFKNMNGFVVHIDDIRQPARAKTVFVLGFDDNGAIMETDIAPMLARYGIAGYVTFTGVYELASALGVSWQRAALLKNTYGWDILNHSWSHGATVTGGATAVTITRASNVCTVLYGAAHGIPLDQTFKAKIALATTPDLNGIFDIYAATTTTLVYTSAGANVPVGEAAEVRTTLADVFGTDTAENRRLFEREFGGIAQVMAAAGLQQNPGVAVWPNNSVPNIDVARYVCEKYGIVAARGQRGGFTFVNEFGIDNPLNIGSQDMDSSTASYIRLSGMKARCQGAIDRGEHCWIYGHYILRASDYAVVDIDYPPGQGGNPAGPLGAGAGGYWYLEQLEDLIVTTLLPAVVSGDAVIMKASDYALYMGLKNF